MSADNWTTCPKCEEDSAKALKALFEGYEKYTADAYGKVPLEDFEAKRREFSTAILNLEERMESKAKNLREDYEFYGADTGTLTISYSCSCRVCNFQWEYNNTEEMMP